MKLKFKHVLIDKRDAYNLLFLFINKYCKFNSKPPTLDKKYIVVHEGAT